MNLIGIALTLGFLYGLWWLLLRKLEYKTPPTEAPKTPGQERVYRTGLLGGLLGGKIQDVMVAQWALKRSESTPEADRETPDR